MEKDCSFTETELEMIELLNDLYSKFCLLPEQHYGDRDMFLNSLRAIQHLVMIRPVRRCNEDLFPISLKMNISQNDIGRIDEMVSEKIGSSLDACLKNRE